MTGVPPEDRAPHGTEARYRRHLREGTPPCERCKEAGRVAQRERRHRRKSRRAAREGAA